MKTSNALKRKHMEQKMTEFIQATLDSADRLGKLDFLTIEISNHNGKLQMDHTIRDRVEVYKGKESC